MRIEGIRGKVAEGLDRFGWRHAMSLPQRRFEPMKSGMSLRDRSVLLTGGLASDARSAYPDLEVLRLDASDAAPTQDVVVEHAIETVGSGARFGDNCG